MKSQPKTYKELKTELDEILMKFEQSTHDDVDMLLRDYEKGQQLIQSLQTMLHEAKERIKQSKQ